MVKWDNLKRRINLCLYIALLLSLLWPHSAPGVLASGASSTSVAQTKETKATNNVPHKKPHGIDEVIEEFREYVKQVRKSWNVPGVSVGIYIDGQVFFINDGVQDNSIKSTSETSKNNVSEHTIFCVMSLSKIMTVIILQQLVDEGLVSLDDPVTKILPWFKLSSEKATQKAKVRHLVSHCIGIPKFSADTLWHLGFSQKEIIEKLQQISVVAEPGEKYAYQNMFVGITGLLIEAVLKKPLADVFQERIFDKLGMKDSSVGPHPKGFLSMLKRFLPGKSASDPHDPARLAAGHINLGGPRKVSVESESEPYVFPGTSGVNSSTADYVKLLSAFCNEGVCTLTEEPVRLFSERAYKTMFFPQTPIPDIKNKDSHFPIPNMKPGSFFYGQGAFGFEYGGPAVRGADESIAGHEVSQDGYTKVVVHEGAGAGWRSLWAFVPEHKVGLVVLSNYGSINTSLLPEAIVDTFLDIALGLKRTDWNKRLLDSKVRLRRFLAERFDQYVLGPPPSNRELVGKYKNQLYGEAEVVEDEKNLCLKYMGRNMRLKHVGGGVFSFDANELTQRYGDDDTGNVYFDVGGKKRGLKISLLFEGSGGNFVKINQ
ncbi:MAG: serine hydrolase [Holosporales bacterium]|jgi:CubicO group peptidase (beta-lactamase class C family)|nr:serine hydrolase [Holosporales bacterium]